jgi:formylglycine-generating enzyme required for sulfatase activity
MSTALSQLNAILNSESEDRLQQLADFAFSGLENGVGADAGFRQLLSEALLKIIQAGEGASGDRVRLGEVLGQLGDPRLMDPSNANYWTTIQEEEYKLEIARHPVSHAEFEAFVNSPSFNDDQYWTAEGAAWRDSKAKSWSFLAGRVDQVLLVPNQPVVGANWYEATAYANFVGARLPTVSERLLVVRGAEKRPYPWGEPFGSNNANTREEVIQRPCAIGLFRSDCTPDGVWDLAGNAGEWLADTVGEQRVFHPGSWKQDSLASWAKARALEAPGHRGDDLGFRLIRDAK